MTNTDRATKFFAFLDAAAAEAAATPNGKLLASRGFTVHHTGGGCLAWQKKDETTGWSIMICDEENGLGNDIAEDKAEFLVGLHTDEGDFLECEEVMTLADCLTWGDAAMGHKTLLKMLADNDGAVLYWQLDKTLVTAALDNCVVKQVGELIVHPDATEIIAGEAYTLVKS